MRLARPLTLLTLIAFALAATTLPACKTKTNDRKLSIVEPTQAEQEMMGRSGLFGGNKPVRGVYLDPRDEDAYRKCHIKGAINVPFPDIETLYSSKLADYDLIIVYDTDYSDIMAKAASKRLQELGHRDVLTLKGGVKAWARDGYPVEGTDVQSVVGKK